MRFTTVLFSVLLGFSYARAQEATGVNSNVISKEDLKPPTSISYTELYSETSSRPTYNSLTTDTRLRYMHSIFSDKLKFYIGASIERDLDKGEKLQFIANAVSPQVGLLYQPFSFLNFWAEYRQRFQENLQSTHPNGESDPRLGISTGYFAGENHTLFEAYGEAVWVSRISSSGVFDAYLRPFLREQVNPILDLDLYTELYSYSSPTKDMGPSRTQARAGGRIALHEGGWQSSLFIYKPWELGPSVGMESSQVEALLVVGGVF